jgi:hypothetical protein
MPRPIAGPSHSSSTANQADCALVGSSALPSDLPGRSFCSTCFIAAKAICHRTVQKSPGRAPFQDGLGQSPASGLYQESTPGSKLQHSPFPQRRSTAAVETICALAPQANPKLPRMDFPLLPVPSPSQIPPEVSRKPLPPFSISGICSHKARPIWAIAAKLEKNWRKPPHQRKASHYTSQATAVFD